jgi:hypothetical protein
MNATAFTKEMSIGVLEVGVVGDSGWSFGGAESSFERLSGSAGFDGVEEEDEPGTEVRKVILLVVQSINGL